MEPADPAIKALTEQLGRCNVKSQGRKEPLAQRSINPAQPPKPLRAPPPQPSNPSANAAGAQREAKGAAEKPRRKKEWCLADFEVGPQKGRGQYGVVNVVRTKEEQMGMKMVFAMKKLDLRRVSESLLKAELDVHRMLRHPNVVRFVTYFTDSQSAYVIMEYLPHGTIWERMHRHGCRGFSEDDSAKYGAQLAEAIWHMHTRDPPVLHRDIKPENTLLDIYGNLKLADFGWSAMLKKQQKGRRTVCGTPDYFSPEMCHQREYGKEVDAWCIGVFIFEMLYGKPPFAAKDKKEVMQQIMRQDELKFPEKPVSESARTLLRGLVEKDHRKRMRVDQIFSHPWILEKYYKKVGKTPPVPPPQD